MLRDLKVLDLSTVLAGPSVATFFAELGAKVIKIEHPDTPDSTREWKLPRETKTSTISAYFSSVNYLKEYEHLDLKKSEDYARFIEYVKEADILISNFKKGDDIKLKITDKQLLEMNASLIIAKISGYGSDSDKVAYDLILQAESGFMSMNGTKESGPIKMPVALIDVLAAHHLKEGILLALYERCLSGKGKSINVSLYDAALSSLTNQASNYLMAGHVPERIGSRHPNIAPYGELFTTSDQQEITLAIGSNHHFNKLCDILELPSLSERKEFSDNQLRVSNRMELEGILQLAIGKRLSNELLSELQFQNIPACRIKNLKEVFDEKDAQNLIRTEFINGVETKRITSVIFK